ncbi:hypothetical protein CSV75_07660 [Sporosarcina sp. P18a]|nr:hypothetical protein CSV75_07660 [Sporosarcina sp. P18a]
MTNANSLESEKIEATIAAEKETTAPEVDTITVANNVGIADTVTLTGLALKDTVKIYKVDGITLLGTAVASKEGELVISLKQQFVESTIKVSLTNTNSNESEKVEVTVEKEAVTQLPE